MDPEEGGALAAARAPLMHDSDPQSPGSPFSRLLTTTPRAENDLYRTASSTEVLRDFGGVFNDQYEFLRSGDAEADAAAEGFYGRSAVHAEGNAAAFLSHSWSDGALLKYLALCYRSNLTAAVVASTIAWIALIVELLALARGDPTVYGGTWWTWWLLPYFAGGPGLVFVVAFLFGNRLPGRRERLWLDKLCIHQRREELRSAGLAGIPNFIERCDRLVILQGESYFERLWCVYEVAVFLASHDAEDAIDVVPLWLAPWLLVTMGASLAGVVLALSIYQWLWAGAPVLVAGLICTLGFVIVAPGAVAAAHARRAPSPARGRSSVVRLGLDLGGLVPLVRRAADNEHQAAEEQEGSHTEGRGQ